VNSKKGLWRDFEQSWPDRGAGLPGFWTGRQIFFLAGFWAVFTLVDKG